MIIDQYWWLVVPGIVLGIYAQIKLSSTYNRYVETGIESGLSGAEAAREILNQAGLSGVPVEEVPGHLTDHYDPLKKALFLSSENYSGRSVAAVGVAAHEAGHALQHQAAYAPLQWRMAMVPVTNIASQAVFWITLLGIILHMFMFVGVAIAAFAVISAFNLITLPVEYDASRRAKEQLLKLGIVQNHEAGAIGKVLNAAALTYVAAMVASLLQLLHFVLLARGSDRDS
jgi:Zn-dependent membrane protease YugP